MLTWLMQLLHMSQVKAWYAAPHACHTTICSHPAELVLTCIDCVAGPFTFCKLAAISYSSFDLQTEPRTEQAHTVC